MYVVLSSLRCRTLYSVITGALSLLLFLSGFFPMKKYDGSIATKEDLPTSIRDLELNVSSLYGPSVGRLVVVVVDALRYDFVAGSEGFLNMPYTASLIEEHQACLFAARANPPTVTMPRIKALTTGTVPNFIDVALNFGSSRVLEDNLILQAEKHGMGIVFYGDDTWLKLFPNSFIRKDGTTSFFVSDFHEVDDNVTRHLSDELSSPDWQIMILHYLGLDHIGHIEGPRGSHIVPKLQEMDSVIRRIHQRLINLGNHPHPSYIVVCGDHGMKDSGGHGGATLGEILVPLVVIGHSCPSTRFDVAQIDVVPTLSVLLGLPIPQSNLGKLIPELVSHLPVERQLYALYYNSRQVAHQYHGNIAGGVLELEEATRLHSKWLSSHSGTDHTEISALYTTALDTMSSRLANSMVTYDVFAMLVALLILYQVCYMLLLSPERGAKTPTGRSALVEITLITSLLLSAKALYCSYSTYDSVLCTCVVTSVTIALVAAVNIHLILHFYHPAAVRQTVRLMSLSRELVLLVLGSCLQLASLGATSLIEEEHQVWYFLWTTFSLLSLYRLVTSHQDVTSMTQTAANLLLLRLLRKWNQTGDKWASVPDIGDWLVEEPTFLSLTLVAGLLGILWSIMVLNKDRGMHLVDSALCVLAVLCVYGYRTATGSVLLPWTYPRSRGITEVRVLWCTLAVLSGRLLLVGNGVRLASVWLLLCAVLHRPHNVVLLAAQVWTSRLLVGNVTALSISHVWLGMVFYFYQGNSNSLASLDIAAGYVGHEGYHPITVGLLLIAHTYSAPVLSYLLLLTHTTQQQLGHVWHVLACLRLLPVSVYAGLVMCQRYHLFVWTVFSPKLLYESLHTGVLLVLLVASNLVTQTFKTKTK